MNPCRVDKEDHRKAMCPRCGRHVGKAFLYDVCGAMMCEACGRKVLDDLSAMMIKEANAHESKTA